MPDMVKLHNEVINDPLNRSYAGMTDAQVLASLKTANRTLPRDTVPAYEVKDAIVLSDWSAISAANREYVAMILNSELIATKPGNIRSALASIFNGRPTLTNLAALQTRPVNRLEELGIGNDTAEGHIAAARSGNW